MVAGTANLDAVALVIGVAQAYRPQEDLIYRALGVLAIGAGFIWVCRTRCLNCGNELDLQGIGWAANAPLNQNFSPRCPHCDVSIDSDVPKSQ